MRVNPSFSNANSLFYLKIHSEELSIAAPAAHRERAGEAMDNSSVAYGSISIYGCTDYPDNLYIQNPLETK